MSNPLFSREKTLNEMLTELKARLGFVTQGVASKQIDTLLSSFIEEGHWYVYEQLGSPLSKKRTEIALSAGSKLYDCHNDIEDEDIDPQQIDAVSVYETENSLVRLRQGITEAMRCEETSRYCPSRYDILNGQIELWPTPDSNYKMVIEYHQGLTRLTQATDRPCVPSRLILLYAIASAKAHYGHADAQTAGSIFQKQLSSYKQKQHENRRYIVREHRCDDGYFVKRCSDGTYVL